MAPPLPSRMTEIVAADKDTQTVQRNTANAVNSVLQAVSQAQVFQALSSAPPFVVRQAATAVPNPSGGAAGGNTGSYFAAVPDTVNSGMELHANSGTPYFDLSTTPNADFEYRLAQDPANGNRRLYVASTITGGGEFLVSPQLTLSGKLVNTGVSSFKCVVGPFYVGPTLAFTAGQTLPAGIANGFNAASFPFLCANPGSILGISGFATASATTTLTARPVQNGTATAAGVAGTVTTSSTPLLNTVSRGTVPFAVNDNIRVDFTSSAACNVSAVFYVLIEFTP